jgi:hypothetical protein
MGAPWSAMWRPKGSLDAFHGVLTDPPRVSRYPITGQNPELYGPSKALAPFLVAAAFDSMLHYEFIVDDLTTSTKPWTAGIPFSETGSESMNMPVTMEIAQ